jgi:hypothetical protein
MEGSGLDQTYQVSVAARASARRPSALRLLGIVVLAALGLASAAAGFAGLYVASSRAVEPLREASASEEVQRFTFDRRAWPAVAVDDLFPPVYHTATAGPQPGAPRDFTRLGLTQPVGCGAAFDPGLSRLLSAHPCGPVLRAGYTDATRTLVATVGVAILGTAPDEQREVSAATVGQHDDLRPHAVAFPGTAATGFGDPQRLTFRVFATAGAPFLAFAVVGFSDGRPASADPGQEALNQSGAQLAAIDLEEMVGRRIQQATDVMWANR